MPRFPTPIMRCRSCRASYNACSRDDAPICDHGRCDCGGELWTVMTLSWRTIACLFAAISVLGGVAAWSAGVFMLLTVGGGR